MVHLIQTTGKVKAANAARMSIDNVVKPHGVPKDFVSDRAPRFSCKPDKHFVKVRALRSACQQPSIQRLIGRLCALTAYLRLLKDPLNIMSHDVVPTS